MAKPIDKSKKANRRCVNCIHYKDRKPAKGIRAPFEQCETADGKIIAYWNCCEHFEWDPDKDYAPPAEAVAKDGTEKPKKSVFTPAKVMLKKKKHEKVESEEIGEVIQKLAASFAEDSANAFGAVVDAIAGKYPPAKDGNLDKFSSLVSFNIVERLHTQLALRYFPEAAASRLLREFIENYNFMDVVLKKLFEKVYGSLACSADRSRWILRGYFNYLKSGRTEIPDMTLSEDCFWKPDFGTALEWMRLCDEMIRLVHGEVLRFYVEYTGLMTAGRTAHGL